MKQEVIVGNLPRCISTACSMFLRRIGTIRCQVSGSKQYSRDLPQGGLKIPCILIFLGHDVDINKLKKLMDATRPIELKTVTLQLVEPERISNQCKEKSSR